MSSPSSFILAIGALRATGFKLPIGTSCWWVVNKTGCGLWLTIFSSSSAVIEESGTKCSVNKIGRGLWLTIFSSSSGVIEERDVSSSAGRRDSRGTTLERPTSSSEMEPDSESVFSFVGHDS